jgi:hypothetical protein
MRKRIVDPKNHIVLPTATASAVAETPAPAPSVATEVAAEWNQSGTVLTLTGMVSVKLVATRDGSRNFAMVTIGEVSFPAPGGYAPVGGDVITVRLAFDGRYFKCVPYTLKVVTKA